MAFKQRNYTEVPHDEALSPQIREFLTSLLSQVNALSGPGNPTTGQGIQALSQNTINPMSGQILSMGNRVCSVTTELLFDSGSTGSTQIKFFWDGVNSGSQLFAIARDDGTIQVNPGGVSAQSPYVITGLTTGATYFFYSYFDETLQKIIFYSSPAAVGTPKVAFTVQNMAGVQQQIAKGHIAVAPLAATLGIKTGSGPGSGGQGGGSMGGSRGGKGILQYP